MRNFEDDLAAVSLSRLSDYGVVPVHCVELGLRVEYDLNLEEFMLLIDYQTNF